MKDQDLFNRSVQILVNAYLNDTLQHGNCCSCAVGNLVAGNMGLKFEPLCKIWEDDYHLPEWYDLLYYEAHFEKMAYAQVESTGYNIEQLRTIEKSFERAFTGDTNEEWNYNGLMAVVDTLCEIHEMNDTTKQETKALFVKPVTF